MYSSGWSSVCTALRLTPGSLGSAFGTANETSTPSRSRRRSQCSRVAWCSWTTKRPPSCAPSGASEGSGSGVSPGRRFLRYVSSLSATEHDGAQLGEVRALDDVAVDAPLERPVAVAPLVAREHDHPHPGHRVAHLTHEVDAADLVEQHHVGLLAARPVDDLVGRRGMPDDLDLALGEHLLHQRAVEVVVVAVEDADSHCAEI